jgi:tetratricopeptide (TPR) repeat protein
MMRVCWGCLASEAILGTGRVNKSALLTAVASAAAAISLSVSAPAQAEWMEAKSPHFIVYGDMSQPELRARTERLERFDALLRTLFNVQQTTPVTVFVLPTIGDIQDLAHNHTIGGFYSADAQLAYMFVPETLPENEFGVSAEAVSQHEYTHHMLLSNVGLYVPGWATEGLAEFFMTARLNRDGSITVGLPDNGRSYEMIDMGRWTVKDLLTSDDRKVGSDEEVQRYSRGWAMIDYLWMSGKRPDQYTKFIDALNQKGDALAAGRQAFGDLDKLNAEINAYLTRRAIPVSKFTAAQLRTPSQITFRQLTPGEAAILPFRMQSLIGVDEKTAPPLADAARPVAANYPNDTFVQRAMAEMEYDAKHFDAADAAADRALADDPKNLMAMTYKGRLAVRRARQSHSAADWQMARSWFLKANAVNPDHPLPFELYYDSFILAGQVPTDDAIDGIYRAVEVMPQDPSLRARAAVELIRAGNIKRARSVLAPAAFYPHASQDNAERKLIEQIDKGTSAKDLLAYAEKEKFLLRLNEFTGPELAKEDADKAKAAGKDGDKAKS